MIKNNMDAVIDAALVVSGIRKMYTEPGSLTIFNDDRPVIKFVRPNISCVHKDNVPIRKTTKLQYINFFNKK